jgi:predicted RNA polymerase sigma factor
MPRAAGVPVSLVSARTRDGVVLDGVAAHPRGRRGTALLWVHGLGSTFSSGQPLIRALSAWESALPADPTGWLITVAWRAFLDMTRSDAARRDREHRLDTEPPAGAIPSADDTLRLYFLCAHPDLTSSSAVALTLRAVGGLTTRQIAGKLGLSPKTVDAHRERIKQRLELKNVTELTKHAVQWVLENH